MKNNIYVYYTFENLSSIIFTPTPIVTELYVFTVRLGYHQPLLKQSGYQLLYSLCEL